MYMPKNTHYIVAIIFIVLIVNMGAVYFGQKHAREEREAQEALLNLTAGTSTDSAIVDSSKGTSTVPQKTTPKTTTLTSGNVAGFNSYANTTYHFSIQYPSYAKPLTSFSTFHEIGNNWRLYAGQANQGNQVVSFSIHKIDQGTYFTGKQTYPLYFTAEVRVGVSANVQECYTPDTGMTNQKISNVTINGIAFKKFSTLESRSPKYTQSESYRTIHNNTCYVIEQIKSGTTERDEKMNIAYSDTQLTNYYNLGEKIVKTFTFTK